MKMRCAVGRNKFSAKVRTALTERKTTRCAKNASFAVWADFCTNFTKMRRFFDSLSLAQNDCLVRLFVFNTILLKPITTEAGCNLNRKMTL